MVKFSMNMHSGPSSVEINASTEPISSPGVEFKRDNLRKSVVGESVLCMIDKVEDSVGNGVNSCELHCGMLCD